MATDSLVFAMNVDNSRKKLIENLRGKGVAISSNESLLKAVEKVLNIQQKENKEDDKFRVIYYNIDGTILKEEYVTRNGTATPPTNPTYDDEYLQFMGWKGIPENFNQTTVVIADYKLKEENVTLLFYLANEKTKSVTLNIQGTGLIIDWGDGIVENDVLTHEYSNVGIYKIKITGVFTFNTSSSKYFLGSVANNSNLIKAYFNKDIVNVGKTYALYQCSKLKVIVQNFAFSTSNIIESCYSLRTLIISDENNLVKISGCSSLYSLKAIYIPNSVEELTSFCNTSRALEYINLPENLKKITGYTLSNESKDTSFTDDVEVYGGLKELTFPTKNNITISGSDTFDGNRIKKYFIPSNVTMEYITFSRFAEEIIVEGNITKQGYLQGSQVKQINAFKTNLQCQQLVRWCTNLEEISINTSSLDYYCFSYSGIRKVILPQSLISIGSNAFGKSYITDIILLYDEAINISLNNSHGISANATIWVNDSIIEELKTKTNWASISSQFMPLSLMNDLI